MDKKETDSKASSPFRYGSIPAHYEEGFGSFCAGVFASIFGLGATGSSDDIAKFIWPFLTLLSWAFLLIGFFIPRGERRGKYWAFILFKIDIVSGFIWGGFIIGGLVLPFLIIGILFKLLFFMGGDPW